MNLNLRTKGMKLLEENTGQKLCSPGSLGIVFLNHPKVIDSNNTSRQNLLQENLRFMDQDRQGERTTYKTGGSICKPYIW